MSMRQVGWVGGGRATRRGVRAFACLAAGAALLGGVDLARGGAPSSQRPEPRLSVTQKNLVELGRRLFFEPALSAGGVNACASCHLPEHGFGDPRRFSPEDVGRTQRHSQSLIDVDLDADQHWDGEFLSIAALVESRTRSLGTPAGYGSGPTTTPGRREPRRSDAGVAVLVSPAEQLLDSLAQAGGSEPSPTRDLGLDADFVAVVDTSRGMLDLRALAGGDQDVLQGRVPLPRVSVAMAGGDGHRDGLQRVNGSRRYLEALTALGGSHKPGTLDVELAGEAIEAYVASIRSSRSPYDRYRAGESDALSESAQRGLALFRGRAGCASCHQETGPQDWPVFRDASFHNNGVAWMSEPQVRKVIRFEGNRGEVEEQSLLDEGRGRFLTGKERVRAFKTPSLRDVARHPPYMHDGSKATLEDVVVHYASGCGDDPDRDGRLKGFEASRGDVQDLVAFLESLTSESRPGLAKEAWKKRAERTRLRFVDLNGAPLAGLLVGLETAGDKVPASIPVPLPPSIETDTNGEIGYVVPGSTHVRLRLPEHIRALGGDLVPDTCGRVDVTLRVAGRVRLALVVDDPSIGTPATVHAYQPVLPRGVLPTPRPFLPEPWVLTAVGTVQVGERTAVLYEGFARSLSRSSLVVRLPGQQAPQEIDLAPGAGSTAGETVRAQMTLAGSEEWRPVAR